MDNVNADFIIQNNNPIQADFELNESEHFDCSFELFAAGTVWGSISGDIDNQTDLVNALNDKQDVLTAGDNVQIENNVISATDTTYTAGVGISIENGVISNTQTSAEWGNIQGDISDQTDLQNALNAKQDTISDLDTIREDASEGASAYGTIQTYGDIVTYDAADFATDAQGDLADTALQPGDDISELNNDAGYITSAAIPTNYVTTNTVQTITANKTIHNAELITDNMITLNGSTSLIRAMSGINYRSLLRLNASGVLVGSVNENLTLQGDATRPKYNANDLALYSDLPTLTDLTTQAQLDAINSGATATNIGQITTNENDIADIRDLIPSQATSSNQLADKDFVNSSIATNTANFIGTFNSVAELEAYSGPLTNNDYAFVATTDAAGNTLYDRYKYNADMQEWMFEYELNNSSFTAAQWASINSGATSTNIGQITTNTSDIADLRIDLQTLSTQKQDKLTAGTDLEIVGGSSLATVNGIVSVILTNAIAMNLAEVSLTGACSQTGTPTPSNPVDIVCNNGILKWDSVNNVIYTDGTAETVTDELGNTATAQKLLALGDYKDVQDVISGNITRNIGIKVLDGTESYNYYSVTQGNLFRLSIPDSVSNAKDTLGVLCNYYNTTAGGLRADGTLSGSARNYDFINNSYSDTSSWKAYLAGLYANGTPVIIIYPLDTATTESVSGQTLTAQAGTNSIEITQASINNLPLSVKYYEGDGSLIINFTNESGYTTNEGTVKSVNNVQPDSDGNVTISIPTDTSDLTNGAGYITGITSSDVTTALGYTPYDSSNPSGYTSNIGTVTSVNNIQPVSGNVTISIPTDTSDLTNGAGFITSSALTDYVTIDTDQNITGTKTFVGQKKIGFKQSTNNDKLGFTLYTSNNTEKGYLEFNPTNQVDGVPLMTLGNYASASGGLTHVGFRKYSSISGANGAYNLLTPLISDAKTPFNLTTTYTNFYLPLGFTDGVTTVKTAKSGLVDISTLLPTVNDGTITINQGGVQKGTFTVNQSGNTTIDLDAGGGTDFDVVEPLKFNTVTIGGTYNITVGSRIVNDYQQALTFDSSSSGVAAISNANISNSPSTLAEFFTGNCSYFDIPTDAGARIANGENFVDRIWLNCGAVDSYYYPMFIWGNMDADGEFTPVLFQRGYYTGGMFGGFVDSVSNVDTNTINLNCTTYSDTSNSASGGSGYGYRAILQYVSSSQTVVSEIDRQSNNIYWWNGCQSQDATILANAKKINMIRVFAWMNGGYPPVSATYSINGTDTDWNINNAAVTSTSLKLNYDDNSLTLNASNELQSQGVIDQNNTTNAIKTWTGTKAQYDAIVTKDANTLYNITDDTDVTLTLLEALYPVGSIYIGTMANCPLATLGVGTWQLKTSRFLVDKYSNGFDWWELYSDGWCEQGGKVLVGTTAYTVTLLKPYNDNKYNITATGCNDANVQIGIYANGSETTSTFQLMASYSSISIYWRTCGYTSETTQLNQWERIA